MPGYQAGDRVIYRRVQRGGYGFVTLVPAVVTGVGKKRVQIEFETVDGKKVKRWVKPESLKKEK